jgi:hypothetical protein
MISFKLQAASSKEGRIGYGANGLRLVACSLELVNGSR